MFSEASEMILPQLKDCKMLIILHDSNLVSYCGTVTVNMNFTGSWYPLT